MKTIQEMIVEILSSGMTEAELARLSNTTQPSIHRMKKGETKDPGYTTGKAIESIFLSLNDKSAA